jgi:hypothetical protein
MVRAHPVSLAAMMWATDARQSGHMSPASRMVLTILADYADATGRNAYPAVGTIAARLGITVRAVQQSLARLEDAGLIRPGDQRFVQHIRPDHRPIVRDLALTPPALPEHGVKDSSPRDSDPPEPVDNRSRGEVMGAHGVKKTSPDPNTEPKTATHLPYLGDPYARESVSRPAAPPGIGITDPVCPACGKPVGRVHRCRASAYLPPPPPDPPPDPPPAIPHIPGQVQLELGLDQPLCTGCGQPTPPGRPLIDDLCARCYVAHSRERTNR